MARSPPACAWPILRVVAGINMDGWEFGDAEKNGVAKPFFLMYSGDGRAPDREEIEKLPLDDRIEGERNLIGLAVDGEQPAALRRLSHDHSQVRFMAIIRIWCSSNDP